MSRIVDCTIFNDEIDLLLARMEYLYDAVDEFIIVESNYTHSGLKKHLNYPTHYSRFSKFKKKINYAPFIVDPIQFGLTADTVVTEFNPLSPHWGMEHAQRDFITEGAKFLNDDDIVLVCDADEIPNKAVFADLTEYVAISGTVSLEMKMVHYNLGYMGNDVWHGPFATTAKTLRTNTPTTLRWGWHNYMKAAQAGWHLVNFGGPKRIINKLESFAHQELNRPEYKDVKMIEFRIKNMNDLYSGELLNANRVGLDCYPTDFRNAFEKFENT